MEKIDNQETRNEMAFPNVLAVVEYLKTQGFKIEKSAAYNHTREGRLKARKDGNYHLRDVMKYARLYLKRVEPGGSQSNNLENLQEKRLVAEVKKAEAQAIIAEKQAEVMSDKYIPKEQMELELAGRAAIFRAGLESWIHVNTPKWINFVDGDLKKVGELINRMQDDLDELLNVYASSREWQIIVDDDINEGVDSTILDRDEGNLDDVE